MSTNEMISWGIAFFAFGGMVVSLYLIVWHYRKKPNDEKQEGHSDDYDRYYCGACNSSGFKTRARPWGTKIPCRFCNFGEDSQYQKHIKKYHAMCSK